MSFEKGQTDAIIAFALETSFNDLPGTVVHAAKRVVLDTIGCAVAGFGTEIGQHLVRLKTGQGGRPDSTLVVSGDRLPCSSISYVHAQLANAMDADETLLHYAHFANSIVMPALAMAEQTSASGKEFLAAVTVGFDIAARIGLSLPAYSFTGNEVRFNPTWGHSYAVFGAVAATGRLLGLNHHQLGNAMGIAYMSAPIHTPWLVFPPGIPRTMTKYTMYGEIADASVNAVLLASQGFTGNHRVLDRDQEFWKGLGAPSCNWEFMLKDLHRRWFITETSFKPYPFGRQANIPIDLFLRIIHREKLSAGEIEKVIIRMPPSSVTKELSQRVGRISQVDASFTLRHALSMAVAGFPPGPQWLSPAHLSDASLRDFERKIEADAKPEWYVAIVEQLKTEGYFKRIPTEVEVHARGKRFMEYAEFAKGDPWTPESAMTDDDLSQKFREFTREAIGTTKAEQAFQEVYGIDVRPNVHGLIATIHL